jgi:tetratricopeptide (TPR) repeat protein
MAAMPTSRRRGPADRVAAWYGPNRRQEPHYGEALAAARAGQPGVSEALARLAADPQQSAIVRATALAALRADASTGMAERIAATRDTDAEGRAAAADGLQSTPAQQRLHALGPLLGDPVLAVRMAAARSLSSLPADRFDPLMRPAFDAALVEYVAAQNVSLDMPGAQLNLAVVHPNTGRPDLAQLYNASARNAEAERVLKEGLKREPGIGELQYALGLLLAEQGRLDEAAGVLAKAAQRMPQRARVHYNLGLALQQLGRSRAAEQALLSAQRLDPLSVESADALAVFYAQHRQRSQALEWADKLQALNPADPQVQQFVQRLSSAR